MAKKIALLAAAGSVALMTAACETTQTTTSASASSAEASRIAELEAELAAARAQASTVRSGTYEASYDMTASAAGYPADAEPGQCFARMLVPAVTETVVEEVVDVPSATQVKIVPAEFDFVEEQVLIKEQSVEYVVVPARYETITEEVMIRAELTEYDIIPARYEEYTEQVLVSEGYQTWKPGAGLFGRAGGTNEFQPTGEILCKVEVPPQYRTVTRKRLVEAEQKVPRTLPAQYETVTKRVVVEPARVEERVIPAEYGSVRVRKQIQPAREEVIEIPASFKTVEKMVTVAPERLEWTEVLCETNTDAGTIRQVQQGLADAGYYEGAVDGAFGMGTLRAMEAFQRANSLTVGQLTIETARALGVSGY